MLEIFSKKLKLFKSVYIQDQNLHEVGQTKNAFSEKWGKLSQKKIDTDDGWKKMQLKWYLKLYGYKTEKDLKKTLMNCNLVLDAGCGLGYKAAWFAGLSPKTIIIAMDYSESIFLAAERYKNIKNLVFIKGDISKTKFKSNSFDFISCDQVLHHTKSPPKTLKEFHRITKNTGLLNTYVYSKKALPRELLDDYFREASKKLTHKELWDLSKQLTTLGKRLSELKISVDIPDIPYLGIKGGCQDIQRFIYWNFIKCFWNEGFGIEASTSTNFDWYSPSTAFRYSKNEFINMCKNENWRNLFFHSEEACYSGRFNKV